MKPLTLVALIAPFAFLAWQFFQVFTDPLSDAMGTDPVAYIHHFLGDTAIRILLITLAISPIRDITGWATDRADPPAHRPCRVLLCRAAHGRLPVARPRMVARQALGGRGASAPTSCSAWPRSS
jgi:hypothetical protein